MKKILMAATAALLVSTALFAQDAKEIMRKSTTIKAPDYSFAGIFMDLYSKDGVLEDHRVVEQFGNHKDNLIQTVFNFKTSTAGAVKGTRFLQADKLNKSDDKWIYEPSLKSVRKVNLTDRKKAFLGSDVTYNDMTRRNADFDEHEMLDANATADMKSKKVPAWKIKSTPVTNKDVEFAYRISYIDKETYLPVVQEFYDKAGNNFKTITITEIEIIVGKTGERYPLRKKQIFRNNKNGHETRIEVQSATFDQEISDRYFTQNWLSTGK